MKRFISITNSFVTIALSVVTLQVNYVWAETAHEMEQMQTSLATEGLRNPHAYSNGFTLTDGPFSPPTPLRLTLADEHSFWAVLGERLEYQNSSSEDAIVYDLQAWYGTTYDRLVIKTEGDIVESSLEESSTDLLWAHALNSNFDAQVGFRLDQYKDGKNRKWLAFGSQGLAPYWFEVDVTGYIGDKGRTALTAEAEYELFLTQRLIMQPRAELSLYGKSDPENNIGSGLSDISLGVRFRYEFSRQFAPYIGVEAERAYGGTADYRSVSGDGRSQTLLTAGLRFWF